MFDSLSAIVSSFMTQPGGACGDNEDGVTRGEFALPMAAMGVEENCGEDLLRDLLADGSALVLANDEDRVRSLSGVVSSFMTQPSGACGDNEDGVTGREHALPMAAMGVEEVCGEDTQRDLLADDAALVVSSDEDKDFVNFA